MTDESTPPRSDDFEALGVSEPVRRALEEMGFAAPFEVQTVCVGPMLDGRDMAVQAHTGSGKTAAFGIPIAERLVRTDERRLQALVLEPTRELALQVAQECERIGRYRGLKVVPIYGGSSMAVQLHALREGAQLAVGTPGRVLDHLRRHTLVPDGVRLLILDECDEMLSRGFLEDIETILGRLPEERQTLLFSATIPEAIERLSRRYLRDPLRFNLSGDRVAVDEIDHAYYLVSGAGRPRVLVSIIEREKPDAAIIFCNRREETSMVASYLSRHGYDAEAISSDLAQADRERVMGLMRERKLRFLVATDIAGRGIDLPDLTHVINYSFPGSPDVYIHRTGRTGRAGKAGIAVSLVGPEEIGAFYFLKLQHKVRPEERFLPSEQDLRTEREAARFAELTRRIEGDPGEEWRSLARRVWQSTEGERIFAQLLQGALQGPAPAPDGAREPARREPPAPAPPRSERPVREPPSRERPTRDPRERRRAKRPDDGRRPPAAPAEVGERDFDWEVWAETKARRDEARPSADRHGGAPRDEAQPSADGDGGAPRDEARPSADDRGDAPREERRMARLRLNVGRDAGVRAADVARLLKDAAGLRRREIGRIHVRDDHTLASVRADRATETATAIEGKELGGKAVVVEPPAGGSGRGWHA